MKGAHESKNSITSLKERVKLFVAEKTTAPETDVGSIRLLSHLTYFGYCFNPVSFYYIYNTSSKADNRGLHSIIAEVSNTPWNEQHSYVLHETVKGVEVRRTSEEAEFEATWLKEFHVSPFMDMDYRYKFSFSHPNEIVKVRALMKKISTDEVWFSASFKLNAIEFNPWNLLYVLIWYPLHTR